MLEHSQFPALPTVFQDEVAVNGRLLQLYESLRPDILLEANLRGYEARLDATNAFAPTAAGTIHWQYFVGALRTELRTQGWSIYDQKNCPFVLSPDGTIALVVMTGNSDTGKDNASPTNQAEKGTVLSSAVYRNEQLQLALAKYGEQTTGTQVWVLLYHVEKGVKGVHEIRSELSLPNEFRGRKIVGWAERIILRPIRPNDPTLPEVAPLPAVQFDVVVNRKAVQ